MVSFIILLIARTARIACPDRQTDRHKPSTVTLAVHARRGVISSKLLADNVCVEAKMTLSDDATGALLTVWANERIQSQLEGQTRNKRV